MKHLKIEMLIWRAEDYLKLETKLFALYEHTVLPRLENPRAIKLTRFTQFLWNVVELLKSIQRDVVIEESALNEVLLYFYKEISKLLLGGLDLVIL